MLIEKFLYSVITDEDSTTLLKVKSSFLVDDEIDYVAFVQDFYATHSKFPDIATVNAKFGISLIKNTEPATHWFDEIYSLYQDGIVEKAILDGAKSKKDAIKIFQQAIVDYNTESEVEVLHFNEGTKRAENYKDRKINKGITYLSTGRTELDEFSLGYKGADLWTIGGFESVGKTWQLLRMANWLDLWMFDNGVKRPILIISGEMTSDELADRLDAIRCELSYQRLSNGGLKPMEERKYMNYLKGFESNIVIVDSFDGMGDIEFFVALYRPGMMFIDGSHLLAPSYDWKDIAQVTARMKKLTRNNKIPIVNTTHLKAEKGKSNKGGELDDFAYTKGYTRDSDIVGVMFQTDLMALENKVGVDWVKVRRGNKSRSIWQTDYENSKTDLVETISGKELALLKSGASEDDISAMLGSGEATHDGTKVSTLFP